MARKCHTRSIQKNISVLDTNRKGILNMSTGIKVKTADYQKLNRMGIEGIYSKGKRSKELTVQIGKKEHLNVDCIAWCNHQKDASEQANRHTLGQL